MKIRLTALCVTLVATFVAASSFAQDCAPCAAAADASCPSCAPCASCTGASCELFGGLRSLLACRPCVSCVTITPSCTPCCTCAPVCSAPAPCKVKIASCGPVVASNLPHGSFDSACASCDSGCSCGAIAAPTCCGPMFPYLKPCLYNAIHRPINGVCKIVHSAFSALACATAPVDDCGFFKPAYFDVPCGSCAVCGPIESAPAPCGCAAPAIPACGPAAPSCK